MKNGDNQEKNLCLHCGFCCNGVIFADVKLQRGDDAGSLRELGLQFRTNKTFPQPCSAFDGCRCRIYEARPTHCRKFECLLLRRVNLGEIKSSTALRLIGRARKQVAHIENLLTELGDSATHLPLRTRFRRISKHLEQAPLDEPIRTTYAELTLAMHDLNVILAQEFYPE